MPVLKSIKLKKSLPDSPGVYLMKNKEGEVIRSMEVKGRNFQTGLPQVLQITEKDMAEAIQKLAEEKEAKLKAA